MEYDKLDLIQKKAETLLSSLKEDAQTSYVTNALVVIVVLFLLPLVILYIVDVESSITKYLIYLIVLLGLLILYRMRVGAAVRESSQLTSYKKIDMSDKPSYITGLLKYLSSGYGVKITRLHSVRWIYVFVFPLVMVLFSELYQYCFHDDIKTGIMTFIVAYLIGSTFWFLYFQKDLHELELDQQDVDGMVGKLFS